MTVIIRWWEGGKGDFTAVYLIRHCLEKIFKEYKFHQMPSKYRQAVKTHKCKNKPALDHMQLAKLQKGVFFKYYHE
jgi:hypothetical protein